MIRLSNNDLSKALHLALYNRMVNFAHQHSPELPAEPIVEDWLKRLYANDPTLHIVVNLESGFKIIEHAVIEIQVTPAGYIIVCHQCLRDKPNRATFEEGIAYIDELITAINAQAAIFFTNKHIKALEKYGYTQSRVIMVKYAEKAGEEVYEEDM